MQIRRLAVGSVVALVLTVPVTLVLTPPVAALQEAMSEEDYAKAMIEIRFLMQDAGLHIDASYWPDLAEDVSKLEAQFDKVEAFWSARGTADGVKLTRAAIAALEPIRVAGDEMSTDGARAALRELQGTCQSCHAQFREETADGFRIKQ
jgi:hypothetical protein